MAAEAPLQLQRRGRRHGQLWGRPEAGVCSNVHSQLRSRQLQCSKPLVPKYAWMQTLYGDAVEPVPADGSAVAALYVAQTKLSPQSHLCLGSLSKTHKALLDGGALWSEPQPELTAA